MLCPTERIIGAASTDDAADIISSTAATNAATTTEGIDAGGALGHYKLPPHINGGIFSKLTSEVATSQLMNKMPFMAEDGDSNSRSLSSELKAKLSACMQKNKVNSVAAVTTRQQQSSTVDALEDCSVVQSRKIQIAQNNDEAQQQKEGTPESCERRDEMHLSTSLASGEKAEVSLATFQKSFLGFNSDGPGPADKHNKQNTNTAPVSESQRQDVMAQKGFTGTISSMVATASAGSVVETETAAVVFIPSRHDSSYTTTMQKTNITHVNPTLLPFSVPLWSGQRYSRRGGYSLYPHIALHEEICDFIDFLQPTEAEIFMRRQIELQISDIAKKLWPDCEPCAYGSMTTHLVLPTSDIDMSILEVPITTEDALVALCSEISNQRLCAGAFPQMILKTKVPLLKFNTRSGDIEVDVSVNAIDGKSNSAVVNKMLKQFPEAQYIILIVKYFLHQRDLDEPYRGGVGSFAVTLLVLSFLQHHPIYTTQCRQRAQYGLGRLLIDFFRFYSLTFNAHRVQISLQGTGSYSTRPPPAMGDAHGRGAGPQLIIEDPANPANNAASSLRVWPLVQTAFESAYMMLSAPWPMPLFAEMPPMPKGRRSSPANLAKYHEELATRTLHPTAPLMQHRPTILSRILHTDPAWVEKRRATSRQYQTFLKTADEAVIQRVREYRADEDFPLRHRQVWPRFDDGETAYTGPSTLPPLPPPPFPHQTSSCHFNATPAGSAPVSRMMGPHKGKPVPRSRSYASSISSSSGDDEPAVWQRRVREHERRLV